MRNRQAEVPPRRCRYSSGGNRRRGQNRERPANLERPGRLKMIEFQREIKATIEDISQSEHRCATGVPSDARGSIADVLTRDFELVGQVMVNTPTAMAATIRRASTIAGSVGLFRTWRDALRRERPRMTSEGRLELFLSPPRSGASVKRF